jgi:hypothetical protein
MLKDKNLEQKIDSKLRSDTETQASILCELKCSSSAAKLSFGESWGKLTLLDQQINSKVFRDDYEPKNKEQKIMPEPLPGVQAGKLFESGEKDD